MNSIYINVLEDFKIQLPQQVAKEMLLKVGDRLILQYDPERLAEKCFFIEGDEKDRLEKEEYFCIPHRLFKSAGIENQDLQDILGSEELTVTTTANIIKALPSEYIEALMEQHVDLNRMADCIAERINENVLESEEESI